MEYLHEMNFLSLLLRMFCALGCGAVIGLERELKGKYAGFRTHILICIASAIVSATSHYMIFTLRQYTDIARLGAQVVSGLGFIGAGTILITKGRRIKGLTTAAGLWTCGIVGLCAGAGFFEGALLTTVLVLFAETVIAKLEKRQFSHTHVAEILVKYKKQSNLKAMLNFFAELEIEVDGLQISNQINNNGIDDDGDLVEAHFTIKSHRNLNPEKIVADLQQYDYVIEAYSVD